jgi:chemotaxis protein methyltransferase CheR
MDDAHLRQILLALGLSWKGYRKVRKGTKRRLERFMQEHGFCSTDSFLSALTEHPDLGKQAQRIAAVSISRFFRDRGLWEILGKQILPSLMASHPSMNKIWSAGCARGEEVYSIKILWEELSRANQPLPSLELWGTDMNEEFLARARAGVYSPSSLKEVKEEWRRRYFTPADPSGLAIDVSLKKGIRWEVHDLIAGEPPAKDFSLIFLRNNLLTYYQEETKNPALGRILQSPQTGGFLVIGAHEKLPEGMEGWTPSGFHSSIYQKTSAHET